MKTSIFFLFLIIVLSAQSQIIYTDINPDIGITAGTGWPHSSQYFKIDLNNDSIFDLQFYETKNYGSGQIVISSLGPCEFISAVGGADTLEYYNTIDSSCNWTVYGLQLVQYSGSYVSGLWKFAINKFIGIRLLQGSDYYYGWIRLKNYRTICDFAMNLQPDSSIKAGEGLPYHIEHLNISDISNYKNGRDLSISYDNPIDSSVISGYRIFVVKSIEASLFNYDSAYYADTQQYTEIPGTLSYSNTIILSDTARDFNHELITEFVPYNVFILSITDDSLMNPGNFSLASNIVTLTSPTSAVTNIIASSTYMGGSDYNISVSFNKIQNESEVMEYRIIFVKSAETSNFTLDSANIVQQSNYSFVTPTGNNYLLNFSTDSVKDKNGNLLQGSTNYSAYVLTVADGVNSNINALSLKSNNFNFSFPVQPATLIIAEDVGSSGNGDDLQISFNKPTSESGISEYRIIAVKLNDTVVFDSQTAYNVQQGNYLQVIPNGNNVVVIIGAQTKDKDGDIIKEHIPYQLYVLSVADSIISNINSLSKKSNIITLSTPDYFKSGQITGNHVVYTNIDPDSTLGAIKSTVTYSLDLNGDGINDFLISATHNSSPSFSSGVSSIDPLNNNAVSIIPILLYPDTLLLNYMINQDLYWRQDLCNINSFYYSIVPGSNNYQTGIWGGENQYMGLKLIVEQDTLYGWLGIKIGSTGFTIRDYAFLDNRTEINEIGFNQEVTIIPNPAQKQAIINFPATKTAKIVVYNIFGKEVFNHNVQNKQGASTETINVSGWAKGMYIVKINTDEGIKTGKLVVE